MRTRVLTIGLSLLLGSAMLTPAKSDAQLQDTGSSAIGVSGEFGVIDVTAGSSRRLDFDFDIPELQIENPDIVRAACMSPNQISLTGIKPGVCTLNVMDETRKIHSFTVNVGVDTRRLEVTLKEHFVDSRVDVTPLQTGVLLTGYVARPSDVSNILAVTSDFFPTNVVNQLQVDGAQIISIEVKVYEVSRAKLRNLGIDWGFAGENARLINGFSDLIADFNDLTTAGNNAAYSVFDNSSSLFAVIRALEQKNVARLMTQPTLNAENGRPAELLSGGEIPIQIQAGLGTNAIQFRPFGTKLDVVPIVHGDGQMTLEVRAEISEIAPELSGDTGVPGFRVRRVNTSATMRAGQTFVLAGVYSEFNSSQIKGAPGLSNKPVIGALFRNARNESTETELVFLLTPRTAAPFDSNNLPAVMPGRHTTNPSNVELFSHGYGEVPVCDRSCPENNPYVHGASGSFAAPADEAPAPQPVVPANPPATESTGFLRSPSINNTTAVPASPISGSTTLPKQPSRSRDVEYFQNSQPGNQSRFGYPESASNGNSILTTGSVSSRTSVRR